MNCLYSLMLTAGSRVNGAKQFCSTAEELHYIRTVKWLKAKLKTGFVKELDKLGYVIAELSEEQVEELKLDSRILSIEKSQAAKPAVVQDFAGWALTVGCGRTDNKFYYTSAGKDVTIYVVDTGIKANLSEFSGRVRAGFDYTDGDPLAHDHGTIVAACAAGVTHGVAKQANIVDVRVGNDLFYDTDVLAGINWILSDHVDELAIVNMSYETAFYSSSLESALAALNAEGVVCVASAGNTTSLASDFYPGNYSSVICVGAIQENLDIAYFSNTGPRVDILAPGRLIRTINSAGKVVLSSGTSLSSAYVAGALACVVTGFSSITQVDCLALVVGQAQQNLSIHTLPTTTKNVIQLTMFKEWFGNVGIINSLNLSKKYKLRAYSTDGVTKTYIQDFFITPDLFIAVKLKHGLSLSLDFATVISSVGLSPGENPVNTGE